MRLFEEIYNYGSWPHRRNTVQPKSISKIKKISYNYQLRHHIPLDELFDWPFVSVIVTLLACLYKETLQIASMDWNRVKLYSSKAYIF